MGKACAAAGIVGHPGIGDRALEHASFHVDADAADMIDVYVADVPVVDPAVVAIGNDADAVAFPAIALDREVGQGQVAHIDAGTDIDLDHRRAVGDVGDDAGPAAIDAHRTLHGAVDVDHDRLVDGVN